MEELQAGKLGAQDWMKFKETIAKLRRFEELMDQGEGE